MPCDLTHEILEDLVERVADVDVAVGVGRAVVQQKLRAIAALLAQALIEVHLGPALQQARLEVGQAGPHGEGGLGQKQRLAPVARLRTGGNRGFGLRRRASGMAAVAPSSASP